MRDAINRYYAHRKLESPSASDALLFLLSEVGELVNAFMATRMAQADTPEDEWKILKSAEFLGEEADYIVSKRRTWTRNHQNQSIKDLPGEIGDVYMMLDRFAMLTGQQEPTECLVKKMIKKGFNAWVETADPDNSR